MAEQFSLMIENTCVTRVKSATAAVEALLAAYYVLNMHYPVEVGATLEFVQG